MKLKKQFNRKAGLSKDTAAKDICSGADAALDALGQKYDEEGTVGSLDNDYGITIETAIITIGGVIIACIFIGWFIFQVNNRIEAGESAMNQVSRLETTMLESEYTMYDATEIQGSQVINIIKKYEEDNQRISIIVNNGRTETTYVYESDLSTRASAKAKDAKNKSALDTYINPSSTYLGEVLRDGGDVDGSAGGTGAIIGLKFVKQ